MARFDMALAVALRAHKGVLDKQGFPYIYHPMRVADMARYCGLDEDCQIIGLLHDTVEDTDLTRKEIIEKFGGRVGNGVDSLTRRNKKNAILDEWGEPVEETYAQFVYRAVLNRDAAKLKMLDNADNMRPERRIEGKVFKLEKRYGKCLSVCRAAVIDFGDIDFLEKFDTLVTWT